MLLFNNNQDTSVWIIREMDEVTWKWQVLAHSESFQEILDWANTHKSNGFRVIIKDANFVKN
jgi:hypothetical protein